MVKKIKIPLKYKFLSVLMFTLALGFSTFFALAYKTFSEDKKLFVMELNLSILKTAISDTRADFKSRIDELQVLLPKLYSPETIVSQNIFRELSLQNLPQDLLRVRFYRRNLTESSYTMLKQFINSELLDSKSISEKALEDLEKNYPAPLETFSFAAGTVLLNRSTALTTPTGTSDLPVLSILIPGTFINDNSKSVIIVVDLLQDFIRKKLSQSELAEVFLLTKAGFLLSHSSASTLTKNAKKNYDHPIAEKLKTRQLPRESFEINLAGEDYLCNISESGLPETYVVSQIKKSEAFAALKTLMQETLLTGIFILSIALILSILFSNRLTLHIKKLKLAAQTIGEHGKLDTPLDIRSNDEIQNVAESFNQMSSEIQDLLVKTKEKARMETELETAKVLQSTLLSSNHVDTDAAQVVPFYLSASETGGDIWDAYLSGNVLTLLVGDATGHGAPAAIVTAVAKSCFATLNSIYPHHPLTPELFLEKLNRVIYESCKGQLLMTMAVVQVNLHTGETYFSNAGHEAPLLLKAPKSEEEKLKSEAVFVRGERLGFAPESMFEKIDVQLEVGDSLLIYTDGVSEAVNPEGKQFGERAIKKLFNKLGREPLTQIKDQLYSELKNFMSSAPQGDDITYVLFKWNHVMEKINPPVEPIPTIAVTQTLVQEKQPQEFREVDYNVIYGEQLIVANLDLDPAKTSTPEINPEGVELALEWHLPEGPVDPGMTQTETKPAELTVEIPYIDEGVQRIIEPVEPNKNEPPSQPLIQLANLSDFTETEVDTNYARMEELEGFKKKSSDDEAA